MLHDVKTVKWLPHPASIAAALALFVFGIGVSFAMALLMPLVFELMRFSPRLGWIGVLSVWLAPIPTAAAIHRATQGILDLADAAPGVSQRSGSSLWAGLFAWSTILLVTATTGLVMLVIDPPPMEPDALYTFLTEIRQSGGGVVRCAIWIVLATYAYELERGARTRGESAASG